MIREGSVGRGGGGGAMWTVPNKRDLSGKLQGECDAVKGEYGKRIRIEDNSYKDRQSALESFLTDKIQQSLLARPLGDNSIVLHKQKLRFWK